MPPKRATEALINASFGSSSTCPLASTLSYSTFDRYGRSMIESRLARSSGMPMARRSRERQMISPASLRTARKRALSIFFLVFVLSASAIGRLYGCRLSGVGVGVSGVGSGVWGVGSRGVGLGEWRGLAPNEPVSFSHAFHSPTPDTRHP